MKVTKAAVIFKKCLLCIFFPCSISHVSIICNLTETSQNADFLSLFIHFEWMEFNVFQIMHIFHQVSRELMKG